MLRERYPEIKALRSERNLGFAGGNNLGFAAATGDYLLLLNNDTEVEDDTLHYLCETLAGNPAIGAVCPKIRFFAPPRHIQFAGYTPLTHVTLRNALIGFGMPDDGSFDTPRDTPYAHGAAMMVRREVPRKAGPMPDIYFLYYEELDWSVRIREQGWKIAYDPRCTVFHKKSATSERTAKSPEKLLPDPQPVAVRMAEPARHRPDAFRRLPALHRRTQKHRRGAGTRAPRPGKGHTARCRRLLHPEKQNGMTLLLDILDWIFIFVLGLPVLYLFVFAAASTRARKDTYPPARLQRRFVTLIPAYKSDAVIVHAAQSALQQDYPQELHEVVVIADRLQPATLAELRRMPIRVLEASFENSSNARALNFAVGEIGPDGAEAVAILDADNLAGREFIARMNDALDSGIQAVQAPHGQEPRYGHRRTRRSERGGQQLDLPPRACGAGILFGADRLGHGLRLQMVPRKYRPCCTTSGEDKELEALLLRQNIYIDYLDDVRVLDEKVQGEGAYYNQRRRWIAAQFYALSSAVRQLPGAILSGNTDYCDKLLQWCLPPRILLLGLVPLWAVVMTVCAPMGSIKWWVAVLLLLLAMAMALPDEQADARLGHALRRMPVLFLLTLANLFRLRGTKDKFIHTEHTGAGSEAPGNNTGNRP